MKSVADFLLGIGLKYLGAGFLSDKVVQVGLQEHRLEFISFLDRDTFIFQNLTNRTHDQTHR